MIRPTRVKQSGDVNKSSATQVAKKPDKKVDDKRPETSAESSFVHQKPGDQAPPSGRGTKQSAARFAATAPQSKPQSLAERHEAINKELKTQVGQSIQVAVVYNGKIELMDAKITDASCLQADPPTKSLVTVDIKVGSQTVRGNIIMEFSKGQFKPTAPIERFMSDNRTEPINLDVLLR
jgi:hypothetical protein